MTVLYLGARTESASDKPSLDHLLRSLVLQSISSWRSSFLWPLGSSFGIIFPFSGLSGCRCFRYGLSGLD
jgi:hypothetical protein